MVRGASSVTATSAARLSVEKLAVLPEPSAMMPEFQLAELVQLPLSARRHWRSEKKSDLPASYRRPVR